MTFESVFAAMGKMIDQVITWHLALPWYWLTPLCMLYFIFIGMWLLRYRTLS